MKKLFKKSFLAFTCLCLCCCAAQAAETTIHVTDPQYTVYVEGVKVAFPTEAGDTFMSTITYQYSTYIPVRNAGEWMGKTVSWDQDTQTVSLTGSGTPVYHTEDEQIVGTVYKEVDTDGQLCPDISVVVDGVKQTFKNEKGAVVHPIRAENVIYLPLRSIGELTGLDVSFTLLSEDQDALARGYIFLEKPIAETTLTSLNAALPQLGKAVRELDDLCLQFSSEVMVDDPTQPIMVMGNMDKALVLLPQMKAKAEETLAILQAFPQSARTQYYHNKILKGLQEMIAAIPTVTSAAQAGTRLGGSSDESIGGSLALMQATGGDIYTDCRELAKIITHKMVSLEDY